MELTKKRIESAEHSECGQWLWGDVPPGFGVRLNPGGSKSYVLSWRDPDTGKKSIRTIGRVNGTYSLKEARQKAREKLVKIQNREPQVFDENTKKASLSVKMLVRFYIEEYSKDRRKTWAEDERRLQKHVVSKWGEKNPETLSSRDMSELHREIAAPDQDGGTAKVEANRVISTIQTMFNFAQRQDLVPEGFNPAKKVKKYPENECRDRVLRKSEVSKLALSIQKESNPFFIGFFWLKLLTACRKSELLKSRWENVAFEESEILIPGADTKSGKKVQKPLTEHAVNILKALPRFKDNPHIFPGRKKHTHLVNVDKAWRRIRSRAGLEDVCIHDLRRTTATWLARRGVSDAKIEKLSGRKLPQPRRRYIHIRPSDILPELQKYSDKLMELSPIDVPNSIRNKVNSSFQPEEVGSIRTNNRRIVDG
jgi:integrase